MERTRRNDRIGPWRLLDILESSMAWRGSLLGGALMLPRHGPPDVSGPPPDPDHELPDSNLGDHEQQAAVQRERARRFVRTARPSGKN
ncbi:MAG TPA: hypothetical protein VFC53_09470 [Dehalococcoidia bacterium]|nr:hypothetical protein [Dehalococcoidia bacterium]